MNTKPTEQAMTLTFQIPCVLHIIPLPIAYGVAPDFHKRNTPLSVDTLALLRQLGKRWSLEDSDTEHVWTYREAPLHHVATMEADIALLRRAYDFSDVLSRYANSRERGSDHRTQN